MVGQGASLSHPVFSALKRRKRSAKKRTWGRSPLWAKNPTERGLQKRRAPGVIIRGYPDTRRERTALKRTGTAFPGICKTAAIEGKNEPRRSFLLVSLKLSYTVGDCRGCSPTPTTTKPNERNVMPTNNNNNYNAADNAELVSQMHALAESLYRHAERGAYGSIIPAEVMSYSEIGAALERRGWEEKGRLATIERGDILLLVHANSTLLDVAVVAGRRLSDTGYSYLYRHPGAGVGCPLPTPEAAPKTFAEGASLAVSDLPDGEQVSISRAAAFYGVTVHQISRRWVYATNASERYVWLPSFELLGRNRRLRRVFSRVCWEVAKQFAYDIRRNKTRHGGQADRLTKPLSERLRDWPLTPKAFRYDRAVGIEIETSCPMDTHTAEAALPYWVRTKGDGSIRPRSGEYGVEFNVLLKRAELEPRLFRLLGKLRDMGCSVNKSCGLHVHFDMRGKSAAEVERTARRLSGWLKVLVGLVPESRRDNQYCQLAFSKSDRYRAVNFTAFQRYETLEVRLHSATLDYTKVLCWVRLLELLMAMKAAPRCEDTLSALALLPLPEHDRAYWLNRHRQLNPSAYAEMTLARDTESGSE